ncbi:hypothetical protein [Bacillus sp. REN3]|uniref:hypothetical protein n=1 Tax=Bacillus sp. REN3 TaxID=2802440 RepID=UPI001AEE6742|nr:hypothetical protein [Bacillus sp. REN3]
MNQSINHFINKAKMSLNQAFGYAKETFYSITGTSSATIQQIADYVKHHPDTNIVRKEYLGIPLFFYELVQDQLNYSLETKHDKILQLDVQSNGHNVISYRSYRDGMKLDTPVKFPVLARDRK